MCWPQPRRPRLSPPCRPGRREAARIRAGDVVVFAAGEKHWHGASQATAMSHIAIAEALDGRSADWMEQVTDAQYGV